MPSSPVFYKYKSVAAFEQIADAIIHSRLYASPPDKLNDPMEGAISSVSRLRRQRLSPLYLQGYRVLSLSSDWTHELMWSHYADGHRGIVLGVRLPVLRAQKVRYVRQLRRPLNGWSQDLVARNLLLRKHTWWAYEQEHRVLTKDKYVPVEIDSIILGERTEDHICELITWLCQKTSPPLVDNIWYGEAGFSPRRGY